MIQILGISLEGYEILHVVSNFFLSEKNPENVIRIAFKVIFKKKEKKNKKKIKKGKMKIFLKLNSNSKICNKKNISYKLKKKTYKEGIGAEHKKLEIVEIKKIKTYKPTLDSLSSRMDEHLSHQVIETDFEIDETNEDKKGDDNTKEFGILIRFEIESEGIESEPLSKRALGLSKYAWNFCTCLWGECEDAYPQISRDINPSEEIQVFLIIPDKLYKSYGQINVLPGADSIHIVKGRDVDSLSLEFEDINGEVENENNKNNFEKEKNEIKKWYKPGSLAISWRFEETYRLSRELVVEHIESFPRLSMFSFIFYFLFVIFISLFSEYIYDGFFIEVSRITFKFSLFLISSIAILVIYILINLKNYAFHEIGTPDEITSYIYYSFLLVFISFISSSFFLFENAKNTFFNIFSSKEYIGTIIIILICSYVLIYKLTPWRRQKKFEWKYMLALLPIAALAIYALTVALAFNYDVKEFSILWAYLCATSVALLELKEFFIHGG